MGAIIIVTFIAVVAVILGFVATSIFTAEKMYLIRPLLAACAVFAIFYYVLWFRVRANIFGEIGFIYLGLASAYTFFPVINFLQSGYFLPSVSFIPLPEELGLHCWRHVLFISGVAVGYLVVRGRMVPQIPSSERSTSRHRLVIALLVGLIGSCIIALLLLSSPVNSYIQHYTRFDHLSWLSLRIVYLFLIFKGGSYFVLLALMFNNYIRYRYLIFILVPFLCFFEIVYSFGSRIEALILLLGFGGFYHYRARQISIIKGIVFLFALAVFFSGVELIRSSNFSLEKAQDTVITKGIKQASEFEAVYNTSFHLYAEREQGTLPHRDWQMFFHEFIAVIPFLNHTLYDPQYWYARNYFPNAVVPPQTMGVLAESAIWGGEFDLLVRSLINGAMFALLTRWFIARQQKWWALTIYIYCYATCIMTLKYSVLYHLTPMIRIVLPTLLLTQILMCLLRRPLFTDPACTSSSSSRIAR
jgi:hypothetical protein